MALPYGQPTPPVNSQYGSLGRYFGGGANIGRSVFGAGATPTPGGRAPGLAPPTGLRTPGYTPNYGDLLNQDPGYMAAQSNNAFAVASAAAQKDAALKALQYDYNGSGNNFSQMAQYVKNLGYLKSDAKYNLGNLQSDTAYNLGNLNSDYNWNFGNLGQDTADARIISQMQLAARGVTQSGETPWAQEHIQRGYDRSLHDLQTTRDRGTYAANTGLTRGTHDINTGLERGTYGLDVGKYNSGKSLAEQAAQLERGYIDAQQNASSSNAQAITDAQGRLAANPLYQPREGFAQLDPDWQKKYGVPVYSDTSGQLWTTGPDGSPVPFQGQGAQ